jgi:quercetin dioxygenase-like cupin family protein
METLLAHSLDRPDERMEFADGRWSRSVAPLAGTDSWPAPHLGYVVSGRLHVRMDDGSQGEAGPGDAFWIAPGHDAWVVGDEPVVLVDVEGAASDGDA